VYESGNWYQTPRSIGPWKRWRDQLHLHRLQFKLILRIKEQETRLSIHEHDDNDDDDDDDFRFTLEKILDVIRTRTSMFVRLVRK